MLEMESLAAIAHLSLDDREHFVHHLLALSWRSYFPLSWIIGAALIASIAAIFSYLRASQRNKAAGIVPLLLRLAVILVLATILAGPSKEIASETTLKKTQLMILADVSESMLTENLDGKTRLDSLSANWLSPEMLEKLSDNRAVSIYSFAERPQLESGKVNLQLEPQIDESTRLVASTVEVMRKISPQQSDTRLLILSDGIDSENTSPGLVTAYARAKNLPIDTVVFGIEAKTCDAAVVAVPMQDYLYPNETGSVIVRIYHAGCAGKSSVLRVTQGTSIKEFPIQFIDNDLIEIEVPVQHADVGEYQYDISLQAIDGEAELRNNDQTLFVVVHPHRIQVLIVEGQPFWDTRFLAQALRKDDRIELTQISQVNRERRQTIISRKESLGPVTVPQTKDEWGLFDVVIFGRAIEQVLNKDSAQALVDQFSEKGGSLIYARGRPYSIYNEAGAQLAEVFAGIESMTWSDEHFGAGKLEITFAGRATRWFSISSTGASIDDALNRLPGLDNGFVIRDVKPSGRVLANAKAQSLNDDELSSDAGQGSDITTDDETNADADVHAEIPVQVWPAILSGTYGAASTVIVAGDGIWRWSLLPPENSDLIGLYDAFWTNMVRFLVSGGDFEPGKQVAMMLDKSVIRTGENLNVQILLKHPSPTGGVPSLILKPESGENRNVPLVAGQGRDPRYHAEIPVSEEGVHQLELTVPGMMPETISRKFSAYSFSIERINTIAQGRTLELISEQTGGRHYRDHEFKKYLDDLTISEEAATAPPRVEYIWDQTWLMVLLGLLAGAEWILRRAKHLI
ncbi:MAG TPA: hypothetical protein PKD64_07170 [Pirellulaceae bacterium]|nr:hypothetical protein [Pirellulaceae bacterium]HMO91965.1 hypothetical protein [Pirellulaceae bacterium]HMP68764.1 hypothetical protein [Pirellulaceae bacterium]